MKPERIQLSDITGLLPEHPVISIAGAGGKTTLMFSLAKIIPGSVITTTTTKVGENQIRAADQIFALNGFPPEKTDKVIWVSPTLKPQNKKIIGCGFEEFTHLSKICRDKNWPLIAETDGAANRHIKAPATHEPVIPQECNVCFYLAGLDVINQPLNAEYVHRPEVFSRITGLEPNNTIASETIAKLLDDPQGGLKNIPANALRIAYLTHADTKERITVGKAISELLQHYDFICIH